MLQDEDHESQENQKESPEEIFSEKSVQDKQQKVQE